HPSPADVDPLGEGLGARGGRVGSAGGHHTREGGDCDDEHGHKPATAADEGRAHSGGRCRHDSLIGEQSRVPGTRRAAIFPTSTSMRTETGYYQLHLLI